MLALIGIGVVFLAVFGGFVLERGNIYVLMQPAELLIVGGAAAGIMLVANPPAVIRKMWQGTGAIFRAPVVTRRLFLENLKMLYELFAFAQRNGITMLENDLDHPEASPIFSNYPRFLRDRATREFVCDSMRMLVIGVTSAHELDHLTDLDVEVQRRDRREPVSALHVIADSLPGLGIVAAVLGVVITMEAIGSSAAVVGEKVAAALVGTFLGILLCYGVVGPAAARLENVTERQIQFLQVLRTAMVAFARGASPILAVEYARRSIPLDLRPSFGDFETTIRREAKIPAPPKPAQEGASAAAPSA